MAKNEIEEKIEAAAKKIEDSAEQTALRFERNFINWVKNDRFFDGFRNTYARILLIFLAGVWLLGGLIYCFNNETGFVLYTLGVGLSVLAQKISVRFAFSTGGLPLADEYQEKRRNRSYRRAYSWVTRTLTGLLAAGLILSYLSSYIIDGEIPLVPGAIIELNLDGYQVATLLVVLLGYFSLLPYFAWGFKGEPWRSKNEPNL